MLSRNTVGRCFRNRRRPSWPFSWNGTGAVAGLLLLGLAAGAPAQQSPPYEAVATGARRPLQLGLAGRSLVILGPGHGDSAGELYRVDLAGELPVDLARQPRVRVPFHDARTATLGSLAIEPGTGRLFLGEENGARIYRLGPDNRLPVYASRPSRLPPR